MRSSKDIFKIRPTIYGFQVELAKLIWVLDEMSWLHLDTKPKYYKSMVLKLNWITLPIFLCCITTGYAFTNSTVVLPFDAWLMIYIENLSFLTITFIMNNAEPCKNLRVHKIHFFGHRFSRDEAKTHLTILCSKVEIL